MAKDQILDRLQKQIEGRMEAAQRDILNSNAIDYADYKWRTGILHGMRAALTDISDLDKKGRDDDE